MSFVSPSSCRLLAMFIALLMCWLAPVSSTQSLPAIPTGQAVVDTTMADASAMLAADTDGSASLVQDDHEVEDGLAWVDTLRCATTPPSADLRVHDAPSLHEHRVAMDLRPPIA